MADSPVQQSQRYIVTRQSELSLLPTYTPGVSESYVDRWRLQVAPLSFSKDRMQFSWRSPGIQTIMSSNLFLEFDVNIKVTGSEWDYMGSKLGQFQVGHRAAGGVNTAADFPQAEQADLTHNSAEAQGCCKAKVAFGDGDAVGQALTSYNLTINSASVSNARMDEYQRTLNRIWYSPKLAQARFGRCGGKFTAYDSVVCTGETFELAHQGTTNSVNAFTGDTGIAKQIQNVLDCVKDIPPIATQVPTGIATVPANDDIKTIRVRWPVHSCGVFSPLQRNDQCASSCPYRSSARAICHANICTLTLLFKDLMKSLVRNLSSTIRGQGNLGAVVGGKAVVGDLSKHANLVNDVVCALPDQPDAQLIIEYLRPPGYRRLPESQALQCFRTSVWDETAKSAVSNPQVIAAGCLESGIGAVDALKCRGTDRRIGRLGASFQKDAPSYYDAQFVGVQSSQLPTYLCFLMQKSIDLTNQEGINARGITTYETWNQYPVGGQTAVDIDDRAVQCQALMRNTLRNASIDKFELSIQSAAGNYVFSNGEFPYLKSRSELYRDIRKHVNLDYPDEGTWDKFEGAIILHVSDFARSLSSDGTSYPCSFSAKVRFSNKAQHVFGQGATGATAGNGIYPSRDAIWGTPLMLGIFPRQSLTLSPSAGILSSMNISHSSAEEILSRM